MNTSTLFELVDLAIGTPDKGSVNFNILHLLLKRILRESHLSDRTVQYRPEDPNTLMAKILGKKGEIFLSDKQEIDENLNEKFEDVESYETAKTEQSTNTDSKIWPAPELQVLFSKVQTLEESLDEVKQNVESLELGMKHKKRGMMKRLENEEDQKSDQESRFGLEREEFEEAIEHIMDSIASLANKLKDEKQSLFGSANEETIIKLCEKVLEKQVLKIQEDFNDRVKSLTSTVANLQDVIKEILYPQAAGVTKCVTCGRTAHLPNMGLLSEIPGDSRVDKQLQELIRKTPVKKKEKQKKHELKFTLLSLNNLKKAAKLPASKFLQQDQDQPLTSGARIASHDSERKERSENVFNTKEATASFIPLRLIPDPTRSGKLLSDEMYINPEVISVNVIKEKKHPKLRFEVKPETEEKE